MLNITVGVLDGFGLAMFLPLLQMVDGKMKMGEASGGNIGFIVDLLNRFGIELTLLKVLLIIVLFFAAKGLVQYTQAVYSATLLQSFIKRIRIRNIANLTGLDYKYFITSDVGRIQNTLTGEVDRVSRAYQTYFNSFQSGVMVIVYMTFAFFVDWKFAIMVSMGGMSTNFIYRTIYKNTKGSSKKVTRESNIFQGLIIQAVANFKYLKATGRLKYYSKKLEHQVNNIEHNNLKIGVSNAVMASTREPLIIFVVSAVIFLQTTLIGSPLSVILISLLFFYRALNALMILQTSWNTFLGLSGSLSNMTSFTEELQNHQEKNAKVQLKKFESEILLKDVSFSYDKQRILSDINLRIVKNETLAFVGESGSGKTTLINLLSGLFPPTEGQMIIDGVTREDLDVGSYQNRIGYITQDPVVFNDTIYNNVTLWAEKNAENLTRFHEACQKAAIAGFIASLSEKEETELGNNGINLSGGQKQRISIARELFKEIDILILDEATSALDSSTESEIQENLEQLKGSFTILVIAHRLSTVKNADNIVFLRSGKILRMDTFEGLTESLPDFKNMVDLQEIG